MPAQKWTEARRKKFIATMKAKHEPKETTIETLSNSPDSLPIMEVNGNGEDAEFAAAFAAAWRAYKGH